MVVALCDYKSDRATIAFFYVLDATHKGKTMELKASEMPRSVAIRLAQYPRATTTPLYDHCSKGLRVQPLHRCPLLVPRTNISSMDGTPTIAWRASNGGNSSSSSSNNASNNSSS